MTINWKNNQEKLQKILNWHLCIWQIKLRQSIVISLATVIIHYYWVIWWNIVKQSTVENKWYFSSLKRCRQYLYLSDNVLLVTRIRKIMKRNFTKCFKEENKKFQNNMFKFKFFFACIENNMNMCNLSKNILMLANSNGSF